MLPIDHQSFRQAAEAAGVRPRVYEAGVDAYPAVDVLAEIEQAGDHLLALARQARIPREDAEMLLQRLLACFAAPLENVNELALIRTELRRFEA